MVPTDANHTHIHHGGAKASQGFHRTAQVPASVLTQNDYRSTPVKLPCRLPPTSYGRWLCALFSYDSFFGPVLFSLRHTHLICFTWATFTGYNMADIVFLSRLHLAILVPFLPPRKPDPRRFHGYYDNTLVPPSKPTGLRASIPPGSRLQPTGV